MFAKGLIQSTALAVVLAAVTLPANAADMPTERDPLYTQAPTQAAYMWTGAYGGLHAGYAWGDSSSTIGVGTASTDLDGFLGGLQLGYNYQVDQFVLGLEGDFTLSGADGSTVAFGPVHTIDQEWMATLRARAGIAVERSLFYVTGGVAFTDVDVTLAGAGSTSENFTGWTVGAGWDYAVNDRFSIRAEYLYAGFEDETVFVGATPVNVDPDQSIARIGFNWRFGEY